MKTDLERRAEKIFDQTLDAPTDNRQAAAIAACRGDAALLARVQALLAADQAEGFLAEPGVTVNAPDTAAAFVGEGPGSWIGPYKLLEKIGEGGFGVVFMAEQEKPVRRRVALKVIKLGMDTREVVARFEAERQALAMMDHPNIARVLDAGATSTGRPYFVMELVRGSPITEYADKRKLSTKDRVALAVMVCRAVQHAHSKGVIHRDLKPSNVLVTVADDKPVPKVIDFGIAKATLTKLTEKTLFTAHRQLIGTPQYMSPEQADSDGVDVDTRTDVYSLGVLLYELLVGTTPIDAKALRSAALEAMRKMISEADPAKPSTKLSASGDTAATIAAARGTDVRQLEKQLHGELDWIVMKALEKDRSRRYDTAAAMADDLGRYLSGDAVLAGPVSGSYRLKKTLKRYKVAVLTGGVIAAVLLLGVAGTTLGFFREAKQRAIADKARINAVDQETIAQTARAQAEHARLQAEQARGDAELQATAANRSAARSDARYLTSQMLLPAAYTRAVDAWKLGGLWEDGFTLDRIGAAARSRWQLAARIPLDDADAGCFVNTAAGPIMVVSDGLTLMTYDANTGDQLQHGTLSSPVMMMLANDTLESVTIVRTDGVDRYQLRDLKRLASHPLTVPPIAADKNATEVVIVDSNGVSRVLSLKDLSDVAQLDWDTAEPGALKLARPKLVAISPSGNRIVLKGGAWTERYTLWEPGDAGGSKVTQFHLRGSRFRFIDDNSILAWFVANSNGGAENSVAVCDLSNAPNSPGDLPERFYAPVSAQDTRDALDAQAGSAPGQEGRIALFGKTGTISLSVNNPDSMSSDRYANLMPVSSVPPTYLAASMAIGLLAIREPHGVSIFRSKPVVEEAHNTSDFTACGCRDGLLYVKHRGTDFTLKLDPFDASKPTRTFNLQWARTTGETPDLLPWALCASPDGSTVVVITQESKDFDNTIDAAFGNAHALVYRNPGGLATAPSTWRLEHAWDLNIAPTGTWDRRYPAIDPAAKLLIYVTAKNSTRRFSLTDGKLVGTLPLANVTHISDDSVFAAGIDPVSGNLNVFEIATGKNVLTIPDQGRANAVCLSSDDHRLLVADGTDIRTYSVPDGHLLSTIHSPLLPLAVLAGDSGRIVALQPDDNTNTGYAGNLVMADPAGRVVTVLVRAGTGFCPARFSPDGQAVAIMVERWSAEVFRSLSPDQLTAALNSAPTIAPPALRPETMPNLQLAARQIATADVLDAADTDGLAARLGTVVDVRGTILAVTFTAAHNAVNFEFAGKDDQRRLVGWMAPKVFAAFTAAYKGGRIEDLKGRQVEMKGTLTRYGGSREDWKQRLEVAIKKPSQFTVLPDKPGTDN